MTTLYDVTGEAQNGVRVPLAADMDSYAEADGLAERYSRDPAWKRVAVRNADTGELVTAYAAGQRERIGTIQVRRN